jgi:hypothetical protein
MQGAYPKVRFTFVAYKDERDDRLPDDQYRLFETGIEAGQPGQIGKMLPVAIYNDMRELKLFHSDA